jgi:hypothetical protein
MHAFLSLSIYIPKILNTLKPSSIIKELSEKISADDLLNEKKESTYLNQTTQGYFSIDDYNVQPIIDIIRTSIISNDNDTAILGMKSIEKRVIDIITNEKDVVKYLKISESFNEMYLTLGKFSIKHGNEVAASQVAKSIANFGLDAFKIKNIDLSKQHTIPSLLSIEVAGIGKNNDESAAQVAKAMAAYGVEIIELTEDIKLAKHIISVHESIEKHAIGYSNDILASEIMASVEIVECGITIIYPELAEHIIPSLKSIGRYALRFKEPKTTYQVIRIILQIRGILSRSNSNMLFECDEVVQNLLDAAAQKKQFSVIIGTKEILSNQSTNIRLEIEEMDNGSYLYNGTIYPL